jgi:uncharacterized membrane protein
MSMRGLKLLVIFMLALLPAFHMVSAQYTVSSLVLTVYGDGYVKVSYELIPDNYTSQIVLPMLGGHAEDVIVEDENGNPLNYQIDNGDLIVYTGNAELVNVTYYTPDLTSKEGIVWTLSVSVDNPFTVVLPEGAIVVDLSDVPMEIAGNSITMPPGNQSISYTIEGRTETSSGTGGASGGGSSTLYYLAVGGIVLAGGAAYLGLRRKSGGFGGRMPTREEFEAKLANLDLNEEEKRALLYIFDKGGKASQAEVREAIGLPKTTAWRMFKRLDRKGLVKILKGKKENWVELRF